MELLEKLNWRYATKMFDSSKKISDKDFDLLLESLRLASSSYWLQPWKFIVVKNPETRAALKEHSWNQGQIVDASHLIVFATQKDFNLSNIEAHLVETAKSRWVEVSALDWYKGMMVKNLLENLTKDQLMTWQRDQVHIALWFLLTACADLQIDSCAIWGFDAWKYDEILGLDKLWLTSVVVCPVWYRSSEDKYSSIPKTRFAKSEVVIEM